MPTKRPEKPRTFSLPPTLALKALALRDDPLVHEHSKIHDQLFSSGLPLLDPSSGQALRLKSQLETLTKKICKTYNISRPDGSYPGFRFQKAWVSLLAQRFYMHNILRISTSWSSSFSPASVNALAKRLSQLPPLPDKPTKDSPPTMTLTLDLSQVKRNNLDPLVEEFKDAIRRCLDEVPKPLRKPPTPWQQNVARDYCRFRQHFYQGVPYRWIAAYEQIGAKPQRPIGASVRAESSVRESVERVYLAVFEKPYKLFSESFKARNHISHRADTRLAHKLSQFNCPEHGPDCGPSLSCPYGTAFYKDLR